MRGRGWTGRVRAVKKPSAARFAEREVHGVDDRGEPERIVIWIERLPGAIWAVGRAVNPQHRPSAEPRRDDYVFQGYELQDALEAANGTLSDDAQVSAQDGGSALVPPFERAELLGPLERWFFGRS
jgi:hypothetical protein